MKILLFIVAALLVSDTSRCANEKLPPKFELKLKLAAVADGDTELRKLQKERYNAALKMLPISLARFQAG